MSESEDNSPVVQLVTTKSDAEIAAELKARLQEAFKPVLAIFDEAATHGLAIRWDAIKPVSPRFKHEVTGLNIIKYF